MATMGQADLARRRLDELISSRSARDLPRPHRGWVRAIRESLGMSATDLGRRMGISSQAVADLEKNELRSAVQLDTLERAAEAMGCEVVYAIVPRGSLENIVNQRAREKAERILQTAGHHARLEDQSVSAAARAEELDDLTRDLLGRRDLWRDTP